MPQINPSIPVAGQPNSTEDPKTVTALTQLVAAVNAVDNAQVAAAAGIVDTKLASPNNAVWRTVALTDTAISGSLPAGTYVAIGGGLGTSGATAPSGPLPIWLPSLTDYEVAGKTTRLRLVATIAANATAPGITLTCGLHTVSSLAGGAGGITPTLGAAVASVAFATPAAGAASKSASTSVDLSTLNSAALYMFGVVLSGTTSANSYELASLRLEMRHT